MNMFSRLIALVVLVGSNVLVAPAAFAADLHVTPRYVDSSFATLVDDLLVFSVDGEKDPFMVALDRGTGEVAEHGDGSAGLVSRQVRALRRETSRGGDREVPVDGLRACGVGHQRASTGASGAGGRHTTPTSGAACPSACSV